MQLIQILKNGYQYSVNDGDEIRQVLVAPNKYMIAAAEGLVGLIKENEKREKINNTLYAQLMDTHEQCEKYQETIKNLEKELNDAKTKIQSLERRASDGDVSGTADSGTS